MQMQVNNTTQNFGSTRINYKKLEKTPFADLVTEVSKYFEPRAFAVKNDEFIKNPQHFTEKINHSQAAVVLGDDFVVIGKDNTTDKFLGRILRKQFGDAATYTNDIK